MFQNLDLPFTAVGLDGAPALVQLLKKYKVVMHAAGPFSFTTKQMVEAFLQYGHFLPEYQTRASAYGEHLVLEYPEYREKRL